jgi:hypothetical protein
MRSRRRDVDSGIIIVDLIPEAGTPFRNPVLGTRLGAPQVEGLRPHRLPVSSSWNREQVAQQMMFMKTIVNWLTARPGYASSNSGVSPSGFQRAAARASRSRRGPSTRTPIARQLRRTISNVRSGGRLRSVLHPCSIGITHPPFSIFNRFSISAPRGSARIQRGHSIISPFEWMGIQLPESFLRIGVGNVCLQ